MVLLKMVVDRSWFKEAERGGLGDIYATLQTRASSDSLLLPDL